MNIGNAHRTLVVKFFQDLPQFFAFFRKHPFIEACCISFNKTGLHTTRLEKIGPKRKKATYAFSVYQLMKKDVGEGRIERAITHQIYGFYSRAYPALARKKETVCFFGKVPIGPDGLYFRFFPVIQGSSETASISLFGK